MTDRAVLIPRISQIVKRGRFAANRRAGGSEIRMALQTEKARLVSNQHPRIRRAMPLVARLAAFDAHRRVLECKWSTLVAVAFHATGLIRRRIA